jgi:predicted nucleic acid-binding protein
VTILADTSVWVSFLRDGRQGAGGPLAEALRSNDVAVCGQVAAELIAGCRAQQQPELWELLGGLPWGGLGRPQWRRVGETAASLRARGQTVPLTDIEIAVVAVAMRWELWSWDGDFARVAEVLPELVLRNP